MKTIRIIALFACMAICIPFYAQTDLEKKARKGNVKAQSELADLYYEKKDYENAFRWAEMAAEKGFAEAQDKLGILYVNGLGCNKDEVKAFEWFMKAAKQGHAGAQRNIGVCYDKGTGCTQDYVKAFEWYLKAANQGLAAAQYTIGYCYFHGEGCKQNNAKAFEWNMKAAKQGHAPAQNKVGNCYSKGEGCKQNYTKAFEWYMKAANQGDAYAQRNIGICYSIGKGCKQDYTKAFEWLIKSANQGNAYAQRDIGICYYYGWGCSKDYTKAFEWNLKAAEGGDNPAMSIVGNSYLFGEGITADEDKALYWYEKGENDAILSFLHYYGIGTTADYSKAFQYALKGAENGKSKAQAMLGHFYTNGIGCEVNPTKAAEWNAKAKENGDLTHKSWEEYEYNGISYRIISPTEVEAYSAKGSYTDDLVIPSFVKIEDYPYVVTAINKTFTHKSKSLRSIIIPNSVTVIGNMAFCLCKNLETIIVPDECFVEPYNNLNTTAFANCLNLKSVKGHNVMYPKWIVEHLAFNDDNSMYEWAKDLKENSYNYFAYDRIVELMTEWQQKKEYETTAQWQARVTEATRAEQLKTVQKQVREEYIAKKKPTTLKSNIGSYDADYGVFPITTDGFGTFYLEVTMAEASQVKANWSKAKVLPTYGIADDKLAVASAEVKVNGKTYKTAARYEHTASDIAINLPPLQINLGGSDAVAPKPDVAQAIDRSIDLNIPVGAGGNDRTFAVIIGNENYKEVAKVPHALNDAKVFSAYCEKTLGLPQKNIKQYTDATFGTMLSAIENIQGIAEAYKGDINVIFYYAGHGIPNESSNEAYLLPVDANGRNTAACYPIDKLYGELKALNARQVTVFLDACFSGAQRGNGMLASARGVAIKAKQAAPQGNMVVFSAASADETAYPYEEKGHGLFTYYLLKKLNETKGNVTLGELGSYICEKVAQEAVVTNGKSQTPTVLSSVNIMDSWKELKLIKQ